MSAYEQLDLFELTAAVVETAKRIAEGEVVNAADKLDLAEQMWEARQRMPADREYGAWWKSTGIGYSHPWRAVLVRAGERIAETGRPGLKPLKTGAEFSIERFAKTGDGWITGDNGAHVSNNSGRVEWYTPPEYVTAARNVMGGIDLDPASSDAANEIVQAVRYYTVHDDGLAHPWKGRVWMNPPYAQPVVGQFCERLVEHFEAGDVTTACVLVNNATETDWFQAVAQPAAAFCFPDGRVQFWAPDKDSASPLQGQALIYLGGDPAAFDREFSDFGIVMFR